MRPQDCEKEKLLSSGRLLESVVVNSNEAKAATEPEGANREGISFYPDVTAQIADFIRRICCVSALRLFILNELTTIPHLVPRPENSGVRLFNRYQATK